MSDRTIHARTNGYMLVVRYDRAGKWYAEYGPSGVKTRLSIAEAVDMATRRGSHVYLGKPGGKVFDARVRDTIIKRVSS